MRKFWLGAAFFLGTCLLGLHIYSCAKNGNDFLAFWETGRAFWWGLDMYSVSRLTGMQVMYMPHFGLLFSPLTVFSPQTAACLWFLAKWLCILYVAVFLSKTYPIPIRENSKASRFFSVLPWVLLLGPTHNELRLGQSNVLVLGFLVAAWETAKKKRYTLAGFWVALSLFKVTTLIFLPYWWWKRQYRVLAATAAWMGVFYGAIALRYRSQFLGVFSRWWAAMREEKLNVPDALNYKNQGLPAALGRVLEAPSLSWGWQDDTLLEVSGAVAAGLLLALTAAFAIQMHPRGGRGFWASRSTPLGLAEYSFVWVMMLLLSPETRTAHQVGLLIPIAVLLLSQWEKKGTPFSWKSVSMDRYLLSLVLVVVYTFGSQSVAGEAFNTVLRAWSLQTIFMLLVLILIGFRVLKEAQRA